LSASHSLVRRAEPGVAFAAKIITATNVIRARA
jgi:hypothetical protein